MSGAIYHCSMRPPVARSAGHSSTAAAAYRSAEKIIDARTGEIHDFTKKQGVLHTELVLPTGCEKVLSRADLWNEVEAHHKRGDAVVAREVIVALPSALDADSRKDLALDLAKRLVAHYGVAADVALHEPSKEGDDRNFHAHILLTACTFDHNGTLGKKAAELDPIHCKRHDMQNAAELFRPVWQDLVNDKLKEQKIEARVDHRTLKAQGIEREPTVHVGPAVTGRVRAGKQSVVMDRIAAQAAAVIERVRQAAVKIEHEIAATMARIKGIKTELDAAKAQALAEKMAAWEAKTEATIVQREVDAKAAEQAKLAASREKALQEMRDRPKPEPQPTRKRDRGYDGPGF